MACRDGGPRVTPALGRIEGNGTIMKKVALTVAVLALGLAACAKNNADNNAAVDTNDENSAAVHTNAAVANDATANADAALNAASNDVKAACHNHANAQDAVIASNNAQ